MVHFWGTEYRAHTSCMSEAQKYQGHLYRGEKKKGGQQQNQQQQQKGKQDQAMVPKAYVEDAPEEGESLQAVAVIDVPPRAPTPPPVNVFDFLVQDATPKAAPAVGGAPARKMLERESSSMYVNHPNDSQYSQYSNGEGATYKQRGYSYGDAPVQPTFERYDSLSNMENSQASLMPGAFETPAPKKEKKDKSDKSDKKRKRHVDDLDLSAAKRPASRDEPMADAPAPPSTGRVLHSGLTGGLSRLVTDPDFYEDRIDAGPTPISPLKRSKRNDHASSKDKDSSSRDDKRKSSYVSHGSTTRTVSSSKHSDDTSSRRRRSHRSPSSSPEPSAKPKSRTTKAIEYPSARAASVQPSASNQVGAHYTSRAELFMSFVNKGPDSERGVSINKALKRYHREKGLRAVEDKEDEDKELWKDLRLRKNERGEIVLFF
jgi:cell growth-regulating nucleolar protein